MSSTIEHATPAEAAEPEPSIVVTTFLPGEKSRGRRRSTTWTRVFQAFLQTPENRTREKLQLEGWSPASFLGDHRRKENVELVYAAVFDFDNTVPNTRPRARVPDDQVVTLERALEAFPEALRFGHTSWSHTPDWPHLRLVLPYSRPVTGEEHDRLWVHLAGVLQEKGLGFDLTCKDASRLWFVPARRDETFQTRLREGVPTQVDEILGAGKNSDERSDGSKDPVQDEVPLSEEDISIDDYEVEAAINASKLSTTEKLTRASRYLKRMPAAVSGSGGHVATIKAASVLVRGFALAPDVALRLLEEEFNPRCQPAWTRKELAHKISDAAKSTTLPLGYLLKPKKETKKAVAGSPNDSETPASASDDEGNSVGLLIEMIEDMKPYRILTGRVFVAIEGEAVPVDSMTFTYRLAHAFRKTHGKATSKATIDTAVLHVLGGELPSGQAPIRYADDGAGGIALDLARKDNLGVHITGLGCSVEPLRIPFHRPDGTKPMPVPVFPTDDAGCAGVFDEYFTAIGLAGDENFRTRASIFAWQMSAMRPMEWVSGGEKADMDESDDDGGLTAYCVLAVAGCEGSGKSTITKKVCKTIDHRMPDLTKLPPTIDDLVIICENTPLLAFDNASYIDKELSDALCRTATGDGNRKRTLFSTRDLSVFRGSRPIVLNGITDVVTEADLLDRALVVRLSKPSRKKTERELARAFQTVWPKVLGALCYCLSRSLARVNSVDEVPDDTREVRMVDACHFASLSEEVAGLPKGCVVDAYAAAKAEAVQSVAEDPIVLALLKVVSLGDTWKGTTAQLLGLLDLQRGEKRPPKGWPEKPRGLTAALQRLQTTLQAVGVTLTFPTGATGGEGNHERVLTVVRGAPDDRFSRSSGRSSVVSQPNLPVPDGPDDPDDRSAVSYEAFLDRAVDVVEPGAANNDESTFSHSSGSIVGTVGIVGESQFAHEFPRRSARRSGVSIVGDAVSTPVVNRLPTEEELQKWNDEFYV